MSNPTATKFIEFLKPRLNRRSVAFFLCLILSGLFWLLTSLSKEYVDEVAIPVSYENLPENLLIVNQAVDVVTAEVKGFGFDLLWHWLQFDKVQITVPANPASLPSTKRGGEEIHYLLTQEKTGKVNSIGDEQLEVLRIYPDTLFLKFKPLFLKKVPVKLDAEVSFEKQFGYDGEPIIEPDSIVISGQREDVQSIEFVSTVKQTWANLDESLTAEVALINEFDAQLVRYSTDQVQVAINVAQFTEGSVTIPIEVVSNSSANVKIYPSEVEVKYQLPLSDYDKVTAEMFRASVTFDENSQDQLLTVMLEDAPVQVRQTRIIPAQVEFIVQK